MAIFQLEKNWSDAASHDSQIWLGLEMSNISILVMCVFIPSPGSTLIGDHRGSILYNRAKTSQESLCGCQPEDMLAQSTLG